MSRCPKIPKLTHARLREALRYSKTTGVFTWRIWHGPYGNRYPPGITAGSLTCGGYVEIAIDGERILAHRLAFFYVAEVWPKVNVDHRNGVRTDNRFSNLREAEQWQNTLNRGVQSNCKTGVKGVVYDKSRGKWRAYVNLKGQHHHVGRFSTLADAERERVRAEKRLHREFAVSNRRT